jgi:hypothetical protein
MHAAHADPRRILIAAIAALLLALATTALVSSLDDLNLGTGGDVTPASAQPAVTEVRTTAPAWVADPVANPVRQLQLPTAMADRS